MDLILASGSTWRRELLEGAGIHCRVVAPDVDEDGIIATSPVELARARARAKARSVAARSGGDAFVIGADQVVHLEGRVLGKPRDEGAQLSMLFALRGRTHDLVTAVALVGRHEERCFEEHTRLTMRSDLGDDELCAYADCREALGCGGGYMIEARGLQLFERVDGDWTNVVGLPLFRLVTELRSFGWRPDFGRTAGNGAAPS